MHKSAQRPRSAMDGPQRARRTAMDEQYEHLANQLTKQRMLESEGTASTRLDDLADIHEFIVRAEHAGRDAMANAIGRRQVHTDVHGAQIEQQLGVHRSKREPTVSRSRRPVSASYGALPRRAPAEAKPGRAAAAPAPEWMPPLPPGRPPPAAQAPPVACWRESTAQGQARPPLHSPGAAVSLGRRPATAGGVSTGALSRGACQSRARFAPPPAGSSSSRARLASASAARLPAQAQGMGRASLVSTTGCASLDDWLDRAEAMLGPPDDEDDAAEGQLWCGASSGGERAGLADEGVQQQHSQPHAQPQPQPQPHLQRPASPLKLANARTAPGQLSLDTEAAPPAKTALLHSSASSAALPTGQGGRRKASRQEPVPASLEGGDEVPAEPSRGISAVPSEAECVSVSSHLLTNPRTY